jgi:hypothetical protein
MPKPAPCGLRTRHTAHTYGDHNEHCCNGEPAPTHHDARHRGRYKSESGWWTTILGVLPRLHRRCGDPDLADEEHYPRSHPRLWWRDRKADHADD